MRLRTFFALAPTTLLTCVAHGQEPTPAPTAGGATVSGVVRDSLARLPLAGAAVQLIAAGDPSRFSRVTVSDSLGRFSIAGVPDGSYVLGFFHPVLDSLGVEAALRAVEVEAQHAVRADLAVPSSESLRFAICGPRAADAGSVVIGVVRDARNDAPIVGATILAEWMELTFSARQVIPTIPGVEVKSGENGWFAVCGLPKAGIIALRASHGTDSTGSLEFDVPSSRFLRRNLYLGPAREIESAPTGPRPDSSSAAIRGLRGDDGRLTGTVVAVESGKPIGGADVGIPGGPKTRANPRGEWTLAAAPSGTRMLEIRAVGFYPVRVPVDIIANASPVQISLFTLKAMLDTVKVATSRLSRGMQTGFDDRRRIGAGTYITPSDVVKHRPNVTSDLFRFFHGVRVASNNPPERNFEMRGAFANTCKPEIYINDHFMSDIGPDELDSWVRPNELEGIEIYSEASVPPQFHRSLAECGAIVIWTKGW